MKTFGELTSEDVELICAKHTISYVAIDPFQGKDKVITSKKCEECPIVELVSELGVNGDCATILSAINSYRQNKKKIDRILKNQVNDI